LEIIQEMLRGRRDGFEAKTNASALAKTLGRLEQSDSRSIDLTDFRKVEDKRGKATFPDKAVKALPDKSSMLIGQGSPEGKDRFPFGGPPRVKRESTIQRISSLIIALIIALR
jgi:hypothetical protein